MNNLDYSNLDIKYENKIFGIQPEIQIRFINSKTGIAVQPKTVIIKRIINNIIEKIKIISAEQFTKLGLLSVKLERGNYIIQAIAEGYQQFSAILNVDTEPQIIEVNLQPIEIPEQLQTKYIISLHRSDATVVVGFVVDEEDRTPISGVRVISLRDGNETETDIDGFFKIYIKVANEDKNSKQPASLLFKKDGYISVEYKYLEIWPNGDLIYRVKLSRGHGYKIIDERKYRRRINESFDESIENCQECTNKNIYYDSQIKRDNNYNTLQESYLSNIILPHIIRVGHNCTGTSCATWEYYFLEEYCKFVLPAEFYPCWGQLTDGINSLKAGAVAIRSYAIWYVFNPLSAKYDICDNAYCQVVGNAQSTYTNIAVDETAGYILINSSGNILKAEYSSENNNSGCGDGYSGTGTTWPCIYDPVCLGQTKYGHGRGLCQWGSVRWATGTKVLTSAPCQLGVSHGYGKKNWQQILNHYYPNYQITQGVKSSITNTYAIPNTINPGNTFSIQYSINSTGTASLNAWSIYKINRNRELDI